jgi:hypothetical protein
MATIQVALDNSRTTKGAAFKKLPVEELATEISKAILPKARQLRFKLRRITPFLSPRSIFTEKGDGYAYSRSSSIMPRSSLAMMEGV